MQPHRLALMIALLLAVAGLAGAAIGEPRPSEPVPRAILFAPGTPAATPGATPLPLYTPIPASAARNVVGRVTIELTDRGFIPSRFEDAINQEIVATLVNTGTRPHNFSIDELDVDVDVAPGETTTLTIDPRRLGEYTYYSDTPEDRALGMRGTMTIFI